MVVDNKKILLSGGLYFLWLTRTRISKKKFGGVILKEGKKGRSCLFILNGKTPMNTLIIGKREKIKEISEKISEVLEVPEPQAANQHI